MIAIIPFLVWQNMWIKTHEDIHEAIFNEYNISTVKTVNYGFFPSGDNVPDNKTLTECQSYSVHAFQAATELYQYQSFITYATIFITLIGIAFLALVKGDSNDNNDVKKAGIS
jgi:hypothetical protein